MEISKLQKIIHSIAQEKGFWNSPRNKGELLMLVVSELAEALEADRKNKFAKIENFRIDISSPTFSENDGENFKQAFEYWMKDTFEDELADAVMRLLDLAEGFGINLERHIQTKMQYNQMRDYSDKKY